MARSLKRIQEVAPADLKGTLSDSDKAMLNSLYGRTTMVGLGSTMAAGALSLRFSRNPLLSGMFGAMLGGLITASDVMGRFPPKFLEHIEQHPTSVESAVVDTVICPAVNEFEPCFSDDGCRARLARGNERAGTLLAAYDACNRRSRQLHQSFSAASRAVAAPEADAPEAHDAQHQAHSFSADAQLPPEPRHPPEEEPAWTQPAAAPAPRASSGWDSPGAPGSSWDAVRARHRAAKEAANRTDGALPDELAPESEPSRPLSAPAWSGPTSDSQGPRPKKNAYGDDILE